MTRRQRPPKTRGSAVASSFARYLGEDASYDARAFFDRDDFVDGDIRELVYLPARPRDFQHVNLRPFSQTKLNPRVVRRHTAHPALGLLHVSCALGGQFERCSDSVT